MLECTELCCVEGYRTGWACCVICAVEDNSLACRIVDVSIGIPGVITPLAFLIIRWERSQVNYADRKGIGLAFAVSVNIRLNVGVGTVLKPYDTEE